MYWSFLVYDFNQISEKRVNESTEILFQRLFIEKKPKRNSYVCFLIRREAFIWTMIDFTAEKMYCCKMITSAKINSFQQSLSISPSRFFVRRKLVFFAKGKLTLRKFLKKNVPLHYKVDRPCYSNSSQMVVVCVYRNTIDACCHM